MSNSILTHEIEVKLQEQYVKIRPGEAGDYFEYDVVCRISHPTIEGWEWLLISQDPEEPEYLWGIVIGHELEVGNIWKPDLELLLKRGYRLDPTFVSINSGLLFKHLTLQK